MSARRWTHLRMLFFAALAFFAVPALAGPQSDARPESGVAPVAGARLHDGSTLDRLKRYEELWVSPDTVALRAAEEELLRRLDRLAPQELVALLRQGAGTRAVNLVLITVENAMNGPRRRDYEDALVAGMERVFEQPDKLAMLSGATLRCNPSPETAEAAARLLMKREPAGRLAEHLGAFAARLERGPRNEIKQFALQRNLIETLGHLVDDAADVARLQYSLGDPATRARAEQALRAADRTVANEALRRQIQGALEDAAHSQ